MKRAVAALVVIGIGLCINAQIQGENEKAVNNIIEEINKAWTVTDGARIMNEVLSDENFYTIIHNSADESKSTIINKQAFIKAFENMLKTNMPKKHIHTIKAMKFYGKICYEIGELLDINNNGKESIVYTFNVFIKYQTGWKLQSTIPLSEMKQAIDEI